MNPKENPEDLIFLDPGLDLVQAVMLFFSCKAAFQPGCMFFAKPRGNDLPLILELACTSFSFEVRSDLLAGTPLPVGIGGIYVIS